MNEKLMQELIAETSIEDIPERYQEIASIVGIRLFVELCDYARGQKIYFPKTENIVSTARNRRIKKEYNGYNQKQLAETYNLTVIQIGRILSDEPLIGQLTMDDWIN